MSNYSTESLLVDLQRTIKHLEDNIKEKNKEIENLFKHHGLFEKDNNQGGTKAVVIVNFSGIDDSKPDIS